MGQPVKLIETMRTLMYLPFYLASVRNEWAAAGLDVAMELSPSIARAPHLVTGGEADVYFGGAMRAMMLHDQDPDCPLRCFGQVVAADPFVLIGRRENPAFRMQDLVGLRVAVACEAPTPWLTLQDDLRRAGVDPRCIERLPAMSMAGQLEALRSGEADVIQVFEPFAGRALNRGTGHLWHRFSARGPMGFTAFIATRAYIDANPDICAGLLRAMRAALDALFDEPADEIARAVAGYFPEIGLQELSRAIGRYRQDGIWRRDLRFAPADLARLKAAMLSGGHIETDPPYDRVVHRGLSLELCQHL